MINLENSKVLITGAAGFVGSNLAKDLLKKFKDIKIVGIDNLNDYYDVQIKHNRLEDLNQDSRFEFIKGDISDKELIDQIFETFHPDVVVNLAADRKSVV